jgi:hypothetical protein
VANYSGLPVTLTGAAARKACATFRRAADDLSMVAAGRKALLELWLTTVGHQETGPLAVVERKIREQAELGLDAEDRTLIEQITCMEFDGEQGRLVFGDSATP